MLQREPHGAPAQRAGGEKKRSGKGKKVAHKTDEATTPGNLRKIKMKKTEEIFFLQERGERP